MQTVDIGRSANEHDASGRKVYGAEIEQVYGTTMYPQYSQLSADIAPGSFSESGQGTATTSGTTPAKQKNSNLNRKPTTSGNTILPSGSDEENTYSPLVEQKSTMTHALIGALLGATLGYAYKKEMAWALGGAAIGFMGTNLYETKSIFG